MKHTTQQLEKVKWTGPIDEWEIQFGLKWFNGRTSSRIVSFNF